MLLLCFLSLYRRCLTRLAISQSVLRLVLAALCLNCLRFQRGRTTFQPLLLLLLWGIVLFFSLVSFRMEGVRPRINYFPNAAQRDMLHIITLFIDMSHMTNITLFLDVDPTSSTNGPSSQNLTRCCVLFVYFVAAHSRSCFQRPWFCMWVLWIDCIFCCLLPP